MEHESAHSNLRPPGAKIGDTVYFIRSGYERGRMNFRIFPATIIAIGVEFDPDEGIVWTYNVANSLWTLRANKTFWSVEAAIASINREDLFKTEEEDDNGRESI